MPSSPGSSLLAFPVRSYQTLSLKSGSAYMSSLVLSATLFDPRINTPRKSGMLKVCTPSPSPKCNDITEKSLEYCSLLTSRPSHINQPSGTLSLVPPKGMIMPAGARVTCSASWLMRSSSSLKFSFTWLAEMTLPGLNIWGMLTGDVYAIITLEKSTAVIHEGILFFSITRFPDCDTQLIFLSGLLLEMTLENMQ